MRRQRIVKDAVMKSVCWKMICIGAGLGLILSGCGKSADENRPEEKVIEGIEALSTERPQLTTRHATTEEMTIEEITTEAAKEPEVITGLEKKLTDLMSGQKEKGMQIAVYVEKLSDQSYVSFYNGQMPAGSLIELFVAGCIYEQKDTLMDTGNSQENIEALVRKMIAAGDGSAADSLVKMLGKGEAAAGMKMVNDYCAAHGFDATSMGKQMMDSSVESNNYTSVRDCSRFLKLVYNSRLSGSESILGYMKQHEIRTGIPSAFSGGTSVANKASGLDNTVHDVAIIYEEDNNYTLCIMISDLTDAAAGRSAISDISSQVNDYMKKGN